MTEDLSDFFPHPEAADAFATCPDGPILRENGMRAAGFRQESDLKTKAEGAAEIVSHVKARRLGDCPKTPRRPRPK